MTSLYSHTAMLNGPQINLKNVNLNVGTQTLLKDINCEFSAGGWHAILGPNGGGKSTLLKTILGLNAHTGHVQIAWSALRNSQANKQTNNQQLKSGNIGYLPQLMPFDSSLPISVRDYLLMSLSHKPVWFKRKLPSSTLEALKFINLDNKLERKIGDLSGGERQRLMLTTALLQKPSLLILDEPMTGLDKNGRKDVLSLLKNFHKMGGTILMVEHDWQLVKDHCDQVYWINQNLEQQCDTDTFFKNTPQSSPAL